MLFLLMQSILKLITLGRATPFLVYASESMRGWSTPSEGQELYDGIQTHSSDAAELVILYLRNGVSVYRVS
jgi:hypothetical protein